MEQSKIHGENQQENLLWWLGGIIDGEGCVTINHHRLHKGSLKETLLFSPIINISNTNKKIIEMCEKILRDNQLGFHITYYEANPSKNYKEKWQIVIIGIKRCVRALNVLSPYVIGKAEEVNLVKRFCEERLRRNKEYNSLMGRAVNGRKYGGNEPYNDTDFDVILKVAQIHNRNPQRLYAEIRDYKEKVAKQDKVRTAAKSAE